MIPLLCRFYARSCCCASRCHPPAWCIRSPHFHKLFRLTPSSLQLIPPFGAICRQTFAAKERDSLIQRAPTIAFMSSPLDTKSQQIDFPHGESHGNAPQSDGQEGAEPHGQVRVQGNQIEPIKAPRLTANLLQIFRYEMTAESLSAERLPAKLSALLVFSWPFRQLAAKRVQLIKGGSMPRSPRIDSRKYSRKL